MVALVERLKSESSPVTLYGLIFLICVLSVLALDSLSNAAQKKKATLKSAQAELAALYQVKETDFWEDRLETSLLLRQTSDKAVWTGNTAGVISANFQQSFQKIIAPYPHQQLRIRIDPEVETISNLNVLTYDVSVLLATSEAVADVLATIANYPKSIIILDADVTLDLQGERLSRITIAGVLPVNISPTDAAATLQTNEL